MSAKGLPPAVRLDPLLPQPYLNPPPSLHSLHHNHHPHPLQSSYECAKQARPPPSSIPVSSLCIEASTSGLGRTKMQTPPISSPIDHEGEGRSHIAKPRGLTPIIITPSSSRAHTPVSSQLLPLPPALCRPPLASSQLFNITNRIGEPRLGPVDLEPLLPTKRETTPKVMGVIDDETEYQFEKEREGRLRRGEEHVCQNQDDDEGVWNVARNPQLPTPHTTPVTQALDTADNAARDREKPGFQYISPRTGKVIDFPSIQLDHGIRPISLDEPCALDNLTERRERDVERGRKRGRGPSRFGDERRHHHHQRAGPYDIKSRPLTKSSSGQSQTNMVPFGREIDGVAAILLAAGMDVDLSKRRGQGEPELHSTCKSNSGSADTSTIPPHPHSASCAASPANTTSVASPPPPASSHQQECQVRIASTSAQAPHRSQTSPPTSEVPLPPRAAHAPTDEMIHLFATELDFQLSREHETLKQHLFFERQQLLTEAKRERQFLEKARTEVQREREELRRNKKELEREREIVLKERLSFKAELETERRDMRAVREENVMLRLRVEQLGGAGTLGSGVNGPGIRL